LSVSSPEKAGGGGSIPSLPPCFQQLPGVPSRATDRRCSPSFSHGGVGAEWHASYWLRKIDMVRFPRSVGWLRSSLGLNREGVKGHEEAIRLTTSKR